MDEDTGAGTEERSALRSDGHQEGRDSVTGDPRCDYVPRPGNAAHRCDRPAVVRVLYRHGAGVNPQYRERCLVHAAGHLGPGVGALWDPLRREWVGTD